jgi:hypothetical protein
MITRLKRVPPDEFLKNVRISKSVLQERFTDEALMNPELTGRAGV